MAGKGRERYIYALGYDRLTPLYDSIVRALSREAFFKAALLRQAGLREGHRVLDVGCGTGTLLMAVGDVLPGVKVDLTGVDGDPRVLAIARDKARQRRMQIRLDRAMAFALPYGNGQFDRVLSTLFFHHLTTAHKKRTLAEIPRVLRPGGELHLADFGRARGLVMRAAYSLNQVLDGFETSGIT